MKYPTIFHLISAEFKKAKVLHILIGGFAVNYYGVSRQTADADFLIAQEDIDKATEILKKAGYKEGLGQRGVFVKLEESKSYLLDIDFVLVDKETLDGILKEGKIFKISGKTFIVPSLNHLIALKLHSIKFNPLAGGTALALQLGHRITLILKSVFLLQFYMLDQCCSPILDEAKHLYLL